MIKLSPKMWMAAGLTGLAIIGGSAGVVAQAYASSSQLVYICGQQPCKGAQELEVFDPHGAPIWSVGEFSGDAVFGDNRSVYPPNTVSNPAVVESYESPVAYGKTSCKAPELWISPTGFYSCRNGKFVKFMNVP